MRELFFRRSGRMKTKYFTRSRTARNRMYREVAHPTPGNGIDSPRFVDCDSEFDQDRTSRLEYYQSEEWYARVARVRSRARVVRLITPICEDCGVEEGTETFHVHHITYARWTRERLSDLILLCPQCHRRQTDIQEIKRGRKNLPEPVT